MGKPKLKTWETCFICLKPNLCDQHHLVPQALWPDNPDVKKSRDAEGNLVPLCKSCHEQITWGFREVAFIGWLMSEINREPGPVWARLLLVKYHEAATLWLQAQERLEREGINLLERPQSAEIPNQVATAANELLSSQAA